MEEGRQAAGEESHGEGGREGGGGEGDYKSHVITWRGEGGRMYGKGEGGRERDGRVNREANASGEG